MQAGDVVVERYRSAQRFLADVGPWLATNEPANNVILALAHALAGGNHPFHEPVFLAAVRERGKLVGCTVRPPPDHLDLTPMPAGAASLLAASAIDHCPNLDAVSGVEATASEFAAEWARLRGSSSRLTHRWSWMAVHTVKPPRPVPGGVRLATAADWPIIESWAPLYMRDTGAAGSVLKFLERRLATRSLYVWEHDGLKCMASISGLTPAGLRVSAVFTPEAHRRLGYASNTVATLSQEALDSGRSYCVLFAESHHVATQRVYERIGYRPTHETVLIELGTA
jgi:predicted GNAT family acetyltransferase